MNLRLLLATASAAAVTALNAHAVTYGNYNLEALTGTGSNTSVCVFDFGTAQYAFGYAHDSTSETGADMLAALNTVGVTVAMTNWGTTETPNFFVDSISYTVGGSTYALTTSANYLDNPYLYPNYWIGNGGETGPISWTSPGSYGISGRTLADGSWDGFTQAKYWSNGTFEASAPSGAFAAVPEPAALGLLALGGLALLRRRR